MNDYDHLLDRPLIFIGPGRSGSTILSEVVMAHPVLAWPSNHLEWFPRAAWLNRLRPLFDNRRWRLVGEKGQLNRTLPLNDLLPRPAEAYPYWEWLSGPRIDFSRGFLLGERATAGERAGIRRRLGRLVAHQGRERLAVKLTGPGRIGYLQSILPGARFVNVVRDPVATVRSLLKVPFWAELGRHRLWWRGAYDEAELAAFEQLRHDPVAATAFQLAKVMSTTAGEAVKVGAAMLTVDYGDFVRAPEATVAEILAFAGLDPDSGVERKLAATPIHDRNRGAPLDPRDEATIQALCAGAW